MSLSLVLTVIGDDRPGIVEQIATTISEHSGNWLESSMSVRHLPVLFASAFRLAARCRQERTGGLSGLRITSEVSKSGESPETTAGSRRLKLSLVGHDRIGIVREVSQVLARHAVKR